MSCLTVVPCVLPTTWRAATLRFWLLQGLLLPCLKLLPHDIYPMCLQNIYLFAAEGDTTRSRPKPQRLRPEAGRETGISPAKRQRHTQGQASRSAPAGKCAACSMSAKAVQ